MPTKPTAARQRHRRAEPAPAGYDASAFPPFAVTVDVVVLTLVDGQLATLLVRRANAPYEGAWALPGGFVLPQESLDDAAARELHEETGVEAAEHLEQLGAYGEPGRDPRMRVVTVAYLAALEHVGTVQAGSDAADAELVPVADALASKKHALAFDHRQILHDALETVRARLQSTSLALAFVGPEFTLSDLRAVYEAVWDTEIDARNFRRRILAEGDLVEPTGRRRPAGPDGGKPAELYRRGRTDALDPPMLPPRRRS